MNSLRDCIKRLEQATGRYEHALTMPDGEQVKFTGEEMVDALIACLEGEEHRLLPYIGQLDAAKAPIANLLGALEGTNDDHRAGASE